MKIKGEFEVHGLVCLVVLVFTSADKDGVHYFQMIQPYKETRKRFKWEPQKNMNKLQPMLEAMTYLVEMEDSKVSKMWRRSNATIA